MITPTACTKFGSIPPAPPPAKEASTQKTYVEQWDEILRRYGSKPTSFSRHADDRPDRPTRGFSRKMVRDFLAKKATEGQKHEANTSGQVPWAP